MATTRICSVPGCDKPHWARSYCSLHYKRWLAHGDPSVTKIEIGGAQRALRDAIASQTDECIPWSFHRDVKGYGKVRVGGIKAARAHRVVCQATNGPPPSPRHEAAHECGHAWCVNPRHIAWKTPLENSQDKYRHGTMCRGERIGRAKLTEVDVKEIRRRAATGEGYRFIRGEYGISKPQMQDIVSRRSWAWLE